MPLPNLLTGIVPPIVTPLKSNDELDHAGVERVIEHVISGGVSGIFALGTTGEAPSLSHRLRSEFIELVCEQVQGRVPVLVGITDTSFTESLEMAEHSADCGADAVVCAPPYYFSAGQDELRNTFKRLIARCPLPMFLYNMPSHCKTVFEFSTVEALSELEKVRGLKDSSGNMQYLHGLMPLTKNRDDFSLLVGPEELLAESLFLGAHGGVSGGSNMRPQLYVETYNAAKSGDWTRVRELHTQIMKVSAAIYRTGYAGSSYLRGVKCAMSLLGLCEDTLAEPFEPFGEKDRAHIAAGLKSLGWLNRGSVAPSTEFLH
jgi:4-hydroxy-tetrahydrodipicolinate synthase